MSKSHSIARRAFLQRLGQLGIAGTAAPLALNLAAISDAAAFSASGYKALVCIFLYGGNDNGNTLIPFDNSNYAEYAATRGQLALAHASLTGTSLGTRGLPAGQQFALAPQLAALKTLFDNQQLAVQLNIGPLLRPTTKADYHRRADLPPKLFSHNDQQSIWQSHSPEGATEGWGGFMGDLALSHNGGNSLFSCMSAAGNAVFLSGHRTLSYQISTSGALAIRGLLEPNGLYGASSQCQQALRTLITQSRTQALENELNAVLNRSISSQGLLSGALSGTETSFDVFLPSTNGTKALRLNQQLKMVARLIAARGQLGLRRQVFMVSLSGFDTHTGLSSRHPLLLAELGNAMAGFQQALDFIGVTQDVTTFTASEFGRTMTSNGDGSDHGWGSVQFVMGGGVKGGAFYGRAHNPGAEGEDDVGQGRYIPTTSVNQFSATLARWFGVANNEMRLIAPNLANFSEHDLGFMG